MKTIRWLILLMAFLLAPLAAADTGPVLPAFQVTGLEDRPAAEVEVLRQAGHARRRIRRRTGADWPGTATIEWLGEREFLERTAFRPEHTMAAADWRQQTVYINSGAWLRSSTAERERTMTHEIAHLLIGSLPGGPELPLWANEGLAMHLAGQWTVEDYLATIQVHASTGLPDLAWLENRFPQDTPSRELAYRTSYLAIAAVAEIEGDEPGSVRHLLRILSSNDPALSLTRRLHERSYQQNVQAKIDSQIGSRISAGVIALTGSGLLLLMASGLVIWAFIKVKARNAERMKKDEDEEAWASSLTEADVQEIYGDREDRWDDEERR